MKKRIGKFFYNMDRVKKKFLKEYKTSLIKKDGNNPLWIGPGTAIKNPQNIYIGNNSYINGGYILAGENSKIMIGENCLISFEVHIRTYSHNYSNSKVPIIEQGDFEKSIIIGNNVWIGHGVQILPGVTIGDNCIIGAGAVVTKNIADNSIAVGVPAKIIKEMN